MLFLLFFWTLVSSLLIVKKELSPAIKDRNMTVVISIINKGPLPAENITVHDQTFNNAKQFKIVSGKNYQKVPNLAINASYNVKFTVVPKNTGSVKSSPAVVKYNDKTSFSNFKTIYVVRYDKTTENFYQWLTFVSLLSFSVIVYAIYVKSKNKKK